MLLGDSSFWSILYLKLAFIWSLSLNCLCMVSLKAKVKNLRERVQVLYGAPNHPQIAPQMIPNVDRKCSRRKRRNGMEFVPRAVV